MGFTDWFQQNRKGEGWEAIPLSDSQKLADKIQMELLEKKELFDPRKIAGLSEAEQMAVNAVTDWMKSGLPGVQEAMDKMRSYMNADMSVKNIPGLQGLFDKTKELGANLLGSTKRDLQISGNAPSASSAGTKLLGRNWQDIQDSFITAAFPFYQQGLANMYSAPERLANLATGDISNRIGAASTVGALPRSIEQQVLDAIFEAQRKTQMFNYETIAPLTQSVMNQTRYGWDPGYMVKSEADVTKEFAGMIGSVIGMVASGGATMSQGLGEQSGSNKGSGTGSAYTANSGGQQIGQTGWGGGGGVYGGTSGGGYGGSGMYQPILQQQYSPMYNSSGPVKNQPYRSSYIWQN